MDKYFTCAEPRYFSFAEMTRTDMGIDNRFGIRFYCSIEEIG